MRMGIHSGALIGSVVGVKMPHFSVFGETVHLNIIEIHFKSHFEVLWPSLQYTLKLHIIYNLIQLNMAQIMESTSEPMKIQISDATKRLLDGKGELRRRRSSTSYHHTKFSEGSKFVTKLREEVFYCLKIGLVQNTSKSYTLYNISF